VIRGFFLFLWLWPGMLWAQEYEIRSGEHEGFSRLVIYFDQPLEWEFNATPDGYELAVEGGRGFAVGGVFDFVPRRRLTDLKSTPGRLKLSVGCDCPVRSFSVSPEILVIDIYSGEPGALEGVEDARVTRPYSERAVAEIKAAPVQQEAGPGEPGDAATALAQSPIMQRPGTGWRDWMRPEAATVQSAQILPFPLPEATEDPVRIDASELVAGIATAASQGFLSLADPDDLSLLPSIGGVQAQLSVRDNRLRSYDPEEVRKATEHCLPGAWFNIHEWGDPEQSPADLLGRFRADGPSELAGDDAVDSAIELVRSYLYLGFGSEAAEVLRTYRIPEENEAQIFDLIARVVENPGRQSPNPLTDQLTCATGASLWAFVASRDAGSLPDDVKTKTILRYFLWLPPWLKVQLGPVATQNFRAIGDADAAQVVSDAVLRARQAQFNENQPVDENGDPAPVPMKEPDLQDEILSDRSARIKAIIANLASGQDATGPEQDEIKALILETRGSEESVALFNAFLASASNAEEVLNAETLITQLSRSRHARSYPLQESWDTLLAAAVAQPSHDTFLGLLSRNESRFRKLPPRQETADAVIARFHDLGLTRSAEHYAPLLKASLTADLEAADEAEAEKQEEQDVSLDATDAHMSDNGQQLSENQQSVLALRGLLDETERQEDTASADIATSPLETLRAADEALELLRGLGLQSAR